ncbi:hypothetical protein [Metabacillus fastidiosus]|uniref:hypothetical protein n=1 Tax=Metabacillus fastidiosus TaxID=1458 RepID=UPI003D2B4373
MRFDTLFNLVDGLIGDLYAFRGLTFSLEHGLFTIDVYHVDSDNEIMFLCDFTPGNAVEPITFTACGVEELKEQIEHCVLQ